MHSGIDRDVRHSSSAAVGAHPAGGHEPSSGVGQWVFPWCCGETGARGLIRARSAGASNLIRVAAPVSLAALNPRSRACDSSLLLVLPRPALFSASPRRALSARSCCHEREGSLL